MTTVDRELFMILIIVSILIYIMLLDGIFLYHEIKDKLFEKGKKNENTSEGCENWDGKNCCIGNVDDRNEYSSKLYR